MKCPEVEKLIEDYHYGELDAQLVQEVQAHLADCSRCSASLESLRSEDKMYEDYGRCLNDAIEIGPSMWDRVWAGLAEEGRVGRRRPLGKHLPGWPSGLLQMLPGSAMARQMLFASLLVLISVGGTLLVVHYYHRTEPVAAGTNAAKQLPPADQKDLESALLSIQKAEQEYLNAIRILNGIVDKRKATLDPGLAAELERNLKAIDAGIASTRKAYYAHPADPELAHYMLTAYQKKVELLQELAS